MQRINSLFYQEYSEEVAKNRKHDELSNNRSYIVIRNIKIEDSNGFSQSNIHWVEDNESEETIEPVSLISTSHRISSHVMENNHVDHSMWISSGSSTHWFNGTCLL